MAKKALRKFRLKPGVGPHFEPNPDYDPEEPEGPGNEREIQYLAGQTVSSTRDLANIFREKFEALDQRGQTNPLDEKEVEGRDGTTDEKAMENVQRVALSDKDKADLAAAKARAAEASDEEEDDEANASESVSTEVDYGDDVTDDYDGARDAGLLVKHNTENKTFHVFDAEDPSTPMKGSKKGFTTKKDLSTFLKKNMA